MSSRRKPADISSQEAVKSINSIRNDLEKMRNEHQSFDKNESHRRDQLRKERDDRIQRMRETAAQEVTNPKSATTKSNVNNQAGAMTRNRCFALFVLFVSIVVGFVITNITRSSFIFTDIMCALRRTATTGLPDLKEIDRLNGAAEASYQAEVHSEDHNRTFFWGTYRPNVLAGVKSRETEPLMFGLAWWDGKRMLPVRHTAEDGEAVFFRWDAHDGRWYGREIIEDRQLGMKLNVRFAKAATRAGWVLNVQSERKAPFQIVFALYFASEFKDNQMSVRSRSAIPSSVAPSGLVEGAFSLDSKLVLSGNLQTNNKRFIATVGDDLGSSQESQWQVFAMKSNGKKDEAWSIDFNRALRGNTRISEHHLYGSKKFPSKISSVVFAKRVTNDFRFTVALAEQETLDEQLIFQDACSNEAIFRHLEKRFDQRFEEVFGMIAHYEALTNASNANEHSSFASAGVSQDVFRVMTQSGLSNLLGGMGYWHGDYLVQTKAANPKQGIFQPVIERHGPRTLFSGVPSRAKFPRGFLWDEGFHQLLVHHWDRSLSEDVLLHWLVGVMEPNGWIPREQILGNEARTRVPSEFVPQHPEHTNPPAMILVIQGMMLDSQQHVEERHHNSLFSAKALPQLRKWFKFLVESQCGGRPSQCSKIVSSEEMKKKSVKELEGQNTTFLFRWRSRNGYHLLASGLDDYPRPHCKINEELHVDLYSWVHMVSRSMKMMKKQLELEEESNNNKDEDDVAAIDDSASSSSSTTSSLPHLAVSDEAWQKWLVDIHWDETRQQFSDVTGCKDKKKHFSHFFGYVSLFPVLTLSLDEAHREQILATIRKAKTELSSGKGLQSLSNRTRKFLDKHDDYWTGPIWININFMFLRAMKRKYIPMIGQEAEDVYNEVRRDVLMNIGRVFAETGKLWENYDFKNGNGRGTAPFTGWTALVILIAAEKY